MRCSRCMCMCVCASANAWYVRVCMCRSRRRCMWRPEDHPHESVLSFYHGGPRDHTQAFSVSAVGAPLWGAISSPIIFGDPLMWFPCSQNVSTLKGTWSVSMDSSKVKDSFVWNPNQFIRVLYAICQWQIVVEKQLLIFAFLLVLMMLYTSVFTFQHCLPHTA